MLFPLFHVTRPLGTGHSNPNDVIRTRKALTATGFGASPPEPSGVFDNSARMIIERFQGAFGLKQDGIINPGGPTESAINIAIAARRDAGSDGLNSVADGFATLARSGLRFIPGSDGPMSPGGFRDRAGRVVSPEDLRGALGRAGKDGMLRLRLNTHPLDARGNVPLGAMIGGMFGAGGTAEAGTTPTAGTPRREPATRLADAPGATAKEAGTGRPGHGQGTAPRETQPATRRSDTPGDSPGSAKPPRKPVIPVPGYRSEVFRQQPKSWQDWADSVGRLPDLSAAEERAYMEIFAAEGGTRRDRRGTAVSGITRETLDDLIRQGKIQDVPPNTPPHELTLGERAEVYRAYFDTALKNAGGSAALDRIGDKQAASALADTLFRHGATGGGELVQKAINEIVPNRVDVDGVVGPKTVGAYKALAGDPATRRQLLDALGNERQNKLGKGKETARIDHFRFQNDSGSTGSK